MRAILRSVALGAATLALAAPAALAEPRDEEIVVRASIARAEIERILSADNLDTAHGDPSELIAAMARIPRGRAPLDFWNSYQSHIRAWELFAAARDHAQSDEGEAIAAERAINLSFDEVERIARRYGAHIPKPAVAFKPAS